MTMMRMKMIAKLPLLSTRQRRAPPFRNVACPQFSDKGLILFLDAGWQTGNFRRERENKPTFSLEKVVYSRGNRAPVAKATHARNWEGPVPPRVRR